MCNYYWNKLLSENGRSVPQAVREWLETSFLDQKNTDWTGLSQNIVIFQSVSRSILFLKLKGEENNKTDLWVFSTSLNNNIVKCFVVFTVLCFECIWWKWTSQWRRDSCSAGKDNQQQWPWTFWRSRGDSYWSWTYFLGQTEKKNVKR